MKKIHMQVRIFMAVMLIALSGCKDDSHAIIDFNKDGKNDVTFEYYDKVYFEFIDRNFDGKVDESHCYSLENRLVSSRVDDDYDFFLESQLIYENETIQITLVDSDRDSLVDIVFFYKFGTLDRSLKFINFEVESKIEEIQYKFGYPGSPLSTVTKMTKKEFSDEYAAYGHVASDKCNVNKSGSVK